MNSFDLVSKQELYDALINIRDNAYSNIDDDWIWIDNHTPLALYIDSITQRME